MAKAKIVHRCTDCGAAFPKWAGQCGSCGAWNTLIEELDAPVLRNSPRPGVHVGEPAVPLVTVSSEAWAALPTGIAELDRVLGGGLIPGSVTLVGGEPGIGKSTLLLQLLGEMSKKGHRCLLVSGEESAHQVKLRAERLGALSTDLWIAPETSLPLVLAQIQSVKPHVAVIDSIQTMSDPELPSAPGSVTQVRECAHALTRLAKDLGVAVILVGHVTKEGNLAGPRVLEHLVDTVLSFEGDRHHGLRMLRAVKHRFGATGELGLFEMQEAGLITVDDPSSMFLADRSSGVPGSIVVPTIEGQRPVLVEVQGLVAPTQLAMPRRGTQGFEQSRLAVLLAVIDRRVGFPISMFDVFVSIVGGVRITEPAADLGVVLAVMSSAADVVLPSDMVAIGEVGLAGEVRQVSHMTKRLSEAARVGIKHAVVPPSTVDPKIAGLSILRVGSISEASVEFGLRSSKPRRAERGERGDRGEGSRGSRTGVAPFSTKLRLMRGDGGWQKSDPADDDMPDDDDTDLF
jgi:DNA repair protein RadA/Sms